MKIYALYHKLVVFTYRYENNYLAVQIALFNYLGTEGTMLAQYV